MKNTDNSLMEMINEMKSELKSDVKERKNYIYNVKQLILIAKNKSENNVIENYKDVIDALYEILEILAEEKENLAANFIVDNPLSMTLEALGEFLDLGLTETYKMLNIHHKFTIFNINKKIEYIFTEESGKKYKDFLDKLEKNIGTRQYYLQKNWVLFSNLTYVRELFSLLSDYEIFSKLIPIISDIKDEKYGEALKALYELSKHVHGTEVVDIWLIKRMVHLAQLDPKQTRALQKIIGQIRTIKNLPLIYTAQSALFEVFQGAQSPYKEAIRRMVLGREADSREEEKEFPTLYYFSGAKAESLLPKFGQRPSTVFRHGIEYWFHYICGIGELNQERGQMSEKLRVEFDKIIHHLMTTDKEPKGYYDEIRKWLKPALGEIEIIFASEDGKIKEIKMEEKIIKTEENGELKIDNKGQIALPPLISQNPYTLHAHPAVDKEQKAEKVAETTMETIRITV